MKKFIIILMQVSFCLVAANLYADQKDADKCSDHPLIPRVPGYYISRCSNDFTNSDMDVINGNNTETIHIEGKSVGIHYSSQPALKSKASEDKLRSDFGNIIKKHNGALIGLSYGQKWPIYKIVKDNKEYFVVLLINSGKYFNGSYTCRIIEKGN